MWVRNIIWFILLIGIVVFSILLFLLIMDPIPDYTEQAVEQTGGQRGSGQEAGGEKEGEIEHNESTSSVKLETEQQTKQQTHEQSSQQNVPAKTIEPDEATADDQRPSSTDQKKVIEKEPPAENAGGKNETGSIWYAFGQGVGYAALFALLIPYMLFLAATMRGSPAFRRLGRATSAPAFSFFSLMGIAVAALHGGMMLRLVEPWNRHLLGGVWLFVFIVFFLLRASLYNSASPFAKGNPFMILTVLILLLFVIHSLG